MGFDSKVIKKSRKRHRCEMCFQIIPKGSVYATIPYQEDKTIAAVTMCAECTYIMTQADRKCFKIGNFTESQIPNCLRKVRDEYRKNPAKAWKELDNKGEENAN